MERVTIRPACADDIGPIVEFWNPVIRETTITFSSEEKTVPGLAALFAQRRAEGRGVLVAAQDGAVLGVALYGQFRTGNGYAHAMEHTIILAPAARGRGIGRALMAALEDHARHGGSHVMVAGVSAENRAGIAFHAALGYVETGRMAQVGRKFARWLDLVLMQKVL